MGHTPESVKQGVLRALVSFDRKTARKEKEALEKATKTLIKKSKPLKHRPFQLSLF